MPLTTMPAAATAITRPLATGSGCCSRPNACHAIALIAASNNTALTRAASTDERRKP